MGTELSCGGSWYLGITGSEGLPVSLTLSIDEFEASEDCNVERMDSLVS